MTMKTLSAIHISECLLNLANEGDSRDMTNLKLQKLLYYAQGTMISLFDTKLFHEDIVKWQYGPVVPEVYHHYKEYGSNIIPPPENPDFASLSKEHLFVMHDVYEFFGQFSAIKLMNLTHSESPWIKTKMDEIITEEDIKEFFDTIVIRD